MTSRNDITGDALKTKTSSDAYREGWDRIFGKQQALKEDDEFRTLLKDSIASLGLTDTEVAEALRVSRPTVNRWLDGESLPHRAARGSIKRWIQECMAKKAVEPIEGLEDKEGC